MTNEGQEGVAPERAQDNRITPEWIKGKVEEIRKLAAYDCEHAHYLEDALHHAVLRAIADEGCFFPSECAHEALKSRELKFKRWYA